MAERSKRIELFDEAKIKNINAETMKLYNRYEMDMSIRELSPKTIYGYKTDLFAWFIYVYENQANQSIKDLDEDDLTEFFYYCKTEGNNTRRIKRRMSSISAFYKYLRKKRIVQENPLDFIDRPRKDTDVLERLFLTQEQLDDMKIKIKATGDLSLLLYVSLSISTMARVNAIANVKWSQIDYENRIINNVLEKEQRMVDLFFSEEVKELFLDWRKHCKDNNINSEYVFVTLYGGEYNRVSNTTLCEWANKAGRLIGVDNCHPHTFRKSGATILKNSGMPLEVVSSLLNHLNTDVTRKFYIKEDTKKIQDMKDKFNI